MEEERTDSSRIFISYRRDDSAWCVTALMDPLRDRFGDRIFKDTDNIAPGQDFLKVINRELESCSVLLAVIGRDWLSATDRANRRRLDNPNDYLRLEIGTALKKDVLVIPVLVGAEMPSPDDLPEDLKPLSYRQSVELSNTRFHEDVQRLIRVIDPVMGAVRVPAAPPPAAAAHEDEATTPADDDLGDLLERRRRQIEDHVTAAQAAFDADDFELVLRHSSNALMLDPQHPDARELARRAKTALVEQKIHGWLEQAQASLRNVPLADADLRTASELIDRALAENPAHAAALKLRTDVWVLRRTREHERDVERQVREALARAQAHFDEEDFDAAIERCDDALAHVTECVEARELRAKAVVAKERARQSRRAQQTVNRARRDFEAGQQDEALARLAQFAPPHELVSGALEKLRHERRSQAALAGIAEVRAALVTKDFDAASARVQDIQEIIPNHPDIAALLAEIQAGRAAAQLAARKRREADAKIAAASTMFEQQNYAAARGLIEAAAALDSAHPHLAAWSRRIEEEEHREAEAAIAKEREEAVRREAEADARRRAQEQANRKAAEDARRRELEAARRRPDQDEPGRRRVGLIAALAVATVVAMAMWLVLKQSAHAPASKPVPALAPGTVALNIAPWANIESITRKSNGAVIGGKDLVTPCVVTLPPGDYHIKATNPGFLEPLELDVNVTSGTFQEIRQALPGLHPDEEVARILGKP